VSSKNSTHPGAVEFGAGAVDCCFLKMEERAGEDVAKRLMPRDDVWDFYDRHGDIIKRMVIIWHIVKDARNDMVYMVY
jgi:hypothetical protein